MRRLVLTAALATSLVFAAIALAAPHSGKWHGRVLTADGFKVNYGYAPNDRPSVVRFKVAKGGHRLKDLTLTIPLAGECGRGPPATDFSVPSAKIRGNGKFKKTVAQKVTGLQGEPNFILKLSGTLSGSKGAGRFSVKNEHQSCTAKYKFKLKH
jgi:hypothetical protein